MANPVRIIACKIFEPELGAALEQLAEEKTFDFEVDVTYLHAGLHKDLKMLAEAITGALDEYEGERIVLLYGSKCHPCFNEMLGGRGVSPFPEDNCVKLIVPDAPSYEKGRIHVSTGWLKHWRELGEDPFGNYDEIGMRQLFGLYDSMILYDTGAAEITDEELMDNFEAVGVPIEIEAFSLEYFKGRIADAIRRAAQGDIYSFSPKKFTS